MKKAGDKLYSQRGATLMMALLLFLICAVLGSVVLVAGTAAAGRFSELSKMEQRYYAVTSAANLLREKLCDEHGVKVVCGKKTETTTTRYLNGTDPQITTSNTYTWTADPTSTDQLKDFLALYAVAVDPKKEKQSTTDDKRWEFCTGKSDPSEDMIPDIPSRKLESEEAALDGIAVDITATLHTDRTITLEISNSKDSAKAKYTLVMTLTPTMTRSSSKTSDVIVTATDENTATEKQTDTETQTVTLVWTVSAIQTKSTQTAEGGSGA